MNNSLPLSLENHTKDIQKIVAITYWYERLERFDGYGNRATMVRGKLI